MVAADAALATLGPINVVGDENRQCVWFDPHGRGDVSLNLSIEPVDVSQSHRYSELTSNSAVRCRYLQRQWLGNLRRSKQHVISRGRRNLAPEVPTLEGIFVLRRTEIRYSVAGDPVHVLEDRRVYGICYSRRTVALYRLGRENGLRGSVFVLEHQWNNFHGDRGGCSGRRRCSYHVVLVGVAAEYE